MLSEIKQVVIAIFILVFVYLLIGFEVGNVCSSNELLHKIGTLVIVEYFYLQVHVHVVEYGYHRGDLHRALEGGWPWLYTNFLGRHE